MKQLSWRFVIGNIVTAILLVVFSSSWKKLSDQMNVDGSDPLYGWILFGVTVVGIFASALKAYDLAYFARVRMKWFQTLFLVFLYLVSMIGALLMVAVATRMIKYYDAVRNAEFIFMIAIVLVAMFILLVLESHFIENRPKKPLSKSLQYFGNVGSMLYSGFGISICWNAFVIGGQVRYSYDLLGFIQLVLTMLFLVFPFQRLFWYELFTDAETKLDHLKIGGAMILTMLSGIIPYYFIDRGI